MKIHTIGFTKITAARFFESLKSARIKRLIDVRLNNSSQLAAFAKKEVLLCSEHSAEHCHRRLVVDYLNAHWGEIDIVHL